MANVANGVYSVKYVTMPAFKASSKCAKPQKTSAKKSDIKDKRSGFKGLCSMPTANMKLSFGMSPPSLAATLYECGKFQQTQFLKIGQNVHFRVIDDFKKLPSITKKVIKKGAETLEQAKNKVQDINRKMIITDGTPKGVSTAVQDLVDDILVRRLKITSIRNNRAPGTPPYLSRNDIVALKKANKKVWKSDIEMKQPREWGYPATVIKVVPKKGKLNGEVQISGPEVDKWYDWTHPLHEMREQRFVPSNEIERQAQKDYYNLSVKKKKRLDGHYGLENANARNQELGIESKRPVYPSDLPESLNPENMAKMAELRKIEKDLKLEQERFNLAA